MDMNGCLDVKAWLTINLELVDLELDGIVGLYPVLGNSDCHVGSISLFRCTFFLPIVDSGLFIGGYLFQLINP